MIIEDKTEILYFLYFAMNCIDYFLYVCELF